ncbi:hypothetical protein NEOLI_000662 [Neolecta irregularis DAH-3]|uniref:Uncharacterized protein n=1 Tax=Neolecta irregularis (strain DAH-3) TaxID=1198029 RepID=A0A1U7LSZ0_NEOID|nr:hypothetical protein NEOLI_000662 [Neolecta irregularis DAH-3]|eukprot:OLL25777.1 hypothetical protein NEOLI_000662 [Neolecta irregularis DAH-3]
MVVKGTPVGNLACQNDSFLQSLKTKVLSCEKVEQSATELGGSQDKIIDKWEIILEDTGNYHVIDND